VRSGTAIAWLATLLYPLAIWLGLARFEPRQLALVLLALAVLRAAVSRDRIWLAAAAGAGMLVAATWLSNDGLPLKLYPVLVNAVLLAVFGASLLRPPTVIERLARLARPDLPPAAIPYVTRVTQVWCVFFVVNGAVALWTAMAASDAAWALYNGVIAYVLIGALLLGERVVRPRHDA
jgi:uncharacterized membrane protein